MECPDDYDAGFLRPQAISGASFRMPPRSSSRDIEYHFPSELDGPLGLRPARTRRCTAPVCLGAVFVCVVVAELIERGLVNGLDTNASFHKTTAMRGAVSLLAVPPMRPYVNDANCKEDGRICICSRGYEVTGTDSNGYNTIRRTGASRTACQQWRFQVGDVILVDKPDAVQQKYIPAMVVAGVTNSPIVHTAVVTQVPPPGVNQTAENIIITEALKGAWKRVVQNTFREIVERYPFGAISIRRVDAKKYPRFFSPERLNNITEWGRARVGDGFDKQMLIPFKRRITASDRFVPINPSCDDRKKAVDMYKQGGPGKWICSELVAWTLAFAGGINLDYPAAADTCEVPPWSVRNVQPFPGELAHTDYFDPEIEWRMPCEANGCFLAVPDTPDWAGGTTSTTTTTTTTTTSTITTTTTTTTMTAAGTSTAVTTKMHHGDHDRDHHTSQRTSDKQSAEGKADDSHLSDSPSDGLAESI